MDVKKREAAPGITVIEMSGRMLMGPDCQLLEGEVDSALGEGCKRVILDFTGVYQIDSAALGKVVMCFTRMKKNGGDMRVAGVRGMLAGVFQMTQVHKVIRMFPTAEEAAANFS